MSRASRLSGENVPGNNPVSGALACYGTWYIITDQDIHQVKEMAGFVRIFFVDETRLVGPECNCLRQAKVSGFLKRSPSAPLSLRCHCHACRICCSESARSRLIATRASAALLSGPLYGAAGDYTPCPRRRMR